MFYVPFLWGNSERVRIKLLLLVWFGVCGCFIDFFGAGRTFLSCVMHLLIPQSQFQRDQPTQPNPVNQLLTLAQHLSSYSLSLYPSFIFPKREREGRSLSFIFSHSFTFFMTMVMMIRLSPPPYNGGGGGFYSSR
jgi:hypothetical protein